ncbi:hypothetical protein ACFLU0_00905 [Chloroflexota bacterium]
MVKEDDMTWTCDCGYQNSVEYTTNKRKLCGAVYLVRGLHIDGSPMLVLTHQREAIK